MQPFVDADGAGLRQCHTGVTPVEPLEFPGAVRVCVRDFVIEGLNEASVTTCHLSPYIGIRIYGVIRSRTS